MRKLGWLGMGVAAAFGWAVGCGGNVVVDHEGAGGSGAATTGPGGMTTAISVTSSSTAGQGGGNPQTLCEGICALGESLSCAWGDSDCFPECIQSYAQAGGCSAELDSYYACALGSIVDCEVFIPQCDPYLAAYEECLFSSSGCDEYECFGGSDGSCGCKGYCNDQTIESTCVLEASGALSCSCIADGDLLGYCQGSGDACNPESGCCSAYFFGFDE